MTTKNKLGQYFTTNKILKEKLMEFILNSPDVILEPCIGQGDLISHIKEKMPKIIFDMYEIDKTIKLLDNIDKDKIIYGDFLQQTIDKKYKTIIGNPPYIKNKRSNLYINFIEKCYNLLDNNGELIFIIPSDFFKLTSSVKLINDMMKNGVFTHIYHPHNEKMFENATIDIMIFRYVKSIDNKNDIILYNNNPFYVINKNGLITFEENKIKTSVIFQDYFDIYVGLVSGKEEVYKNDKLGNINVLNGKNKINKYIFINKFPCENNEINNYLYEHKEELIERKIRKFNDNNWYQWGAIRNINVMTNNNDELCIYIYNLTRNTEIAFIDNINYFGGGLLMLKPKKECNLKSIVAYLNSEKFKNNFLYSGRFKIGHRQISNSYIPNEYLL